MTIDEMNDVAAATIALGLGGTLTTYLSNGRESGVVEVVVPPEVIDKHTRVKTYIHMGWDKRHGADISETVYYIRRLCIFAARPPYDTSYDVTWDVLADHLGDLIPRLSPGELDCPHPRPRRRHGRCNVCGSTV